MPFSKKLMATVAKTFKQSPIWNNPMNSKTIKAMKETTARFITELKEQGRANLRFATNYDGYHVPFPQGNNKLGSVFHTVSFRPILDCGNCSGCNKQCYDLRHDVTNRACMELRCLTAAIYEVDPMRFWTEVDAQAALTRFFRYNIGGDIKDAFWFEMARAVARKNPHTQFLLFTKMYHIVADSIQADGSLPENMHVILSRWPGVEMYNPYSLPTSFPIFSDEDCKANPVLAKFQSESPKFYWHCNDDCTDCVICTSGCFKLSLNESVGFAYH